jgi:hypothetical protein
MSPTRRTPAGLRLAGIAAVLLAATFLAAGTALAIDPPPQQPNQLRAWLVGHLVTDMEALGTFDGNTLAKVPGVINGLSDDQIALLAQYYYLTRSKTEQDARIYAMQQQAVTAVQLNAVRAEIADLLAAMNDQILACYRELALMPQPVQYVAQICYASVPGWCCYASCFVPPWYYDNGLFVGPCYNAACAGVWAVPVYRAYYDHGSRFYTRYHGLANSLYANRSITLAKRHADWLRQQGDWRAALAHDRLVRQGPAVSHAAGPRNSLGVRAAAVPGAAGHNEAKQHGTGGHPAAAPRQPGITHAASRSNGMGKPAGKPQIKHVSLTQSPKARPKAAGAGVKRVSAPRPRTAHTVAHASHPRTAAHAHSRVRRTPHGHAHVQHAAHRHPQHAAHAHGHARAAGHGKHR